MALPLFHAGAIWSMIAAAAACGAQDPLQPLCPSSAPDPEISLVQATLLRHAPSSALQSSQDRSGAGEKTGRAAPVECLPGELLTLGSTTSDILVEEGLCHIRGVTTIGSVIVSGGADLLIEGPETDIRGGLKVEGSPDSNITVHGAELGQVTFRSSGNLDISGGSKIGPIDFTNSGSAVISNSTVFEVSLFDSGNITITDGADVGNVESKGSGFVTITGGAAVTSVSVENSKSVKLSGGASVTRDIGASNVEGMIELDGVTLGGPLGVDTSPSALVRIVRSKVPEISLADSGDLEVASGASIGSIEIKGSGHTWLSGSEASEVKLAESGNLTLSARAKVRAVDVHESGSIDISRDVVLSSLKSLASRSIIVSDNVAVENDVEVTELHGSFRLSTSTVGGPMSLKSAVGDIVIDASEVITGGLFLEKCTGSAGLKSSSLPGVEVKGLSGNITFADMQASNLRLEGVEGEVLFSGVKTSGSSMFSDIGGGVVCPALARPTAGAAASSLADLPPSAWRAWLEAGWWQAA